jgi:hypothetical protein
VTEIPEIRSSWKFEFHHRRAISEKNMHTSDKPTYFLYFFSLPLQSELTLSLNTCAANRLKNGLLTFLKALRSIFCCTFLFGESQSNCPARKSFGCIVITSFLSVLFYDFLPDESRASSDIHRNINNDMSQRKTFSLGAKHRATLTCLLS